MDKYTNCSKGYGFVVFNNAASAVAACVNGNPVIDGKVGNCNLASHGVANLPSNRSFKRAWEGVPAQTPFKKPRVTQPGTNAYILKLQQEGTDVSFEACVAKIDELIKTNPPEALKFFCEIGDIFRGSSRFDYFSNNLVDAAFHFRQTGEVKEIPEFKDKNEGNGSQGNEYQSSWQGGSVGLYQQGEYLQPNGQYGQEGMENEVQYDQGQGYQEAQGEYQQQEVHEQYGQEGQAYEAQYDEQGGQYEAGLGQTEQWGEADNEMPAQLS